MRLNTNINKFLLLLWKNFLLQWRHPLQTLIEIAAPIIFTALLVIVRGLVDVEPHSVRFFLPFYPTLLSDTYLQLHAIPWSPATNPHLKTIMRNAVDKLNEGRNVSQLWLVPCNNSQDLENFGRLPNVKLYGGVQFDDNLAGNKKLPPNINVTLRFPAELRKYQYLNNWRTNRLFPGYQTPGPRDWKVNNGAEPRYNSEGFLKLQLEVSLSIINYFNGNFPVNAPSILMQRFDYPKWTEDLLLQALELFVGLIVMLSFVYTCISTVKVITAEKEKQLKEAMKIMGLPGWLHWTAWFIKTFTFLFISIIVMVILLKAKWYPGTSQTIFTHSNPFVIFLFLLLFICSIITFCFAVSVFFSKANTAATVAGLAWFLSYFPFSLMQEKYDTMSLTEKLLSSLFSNTAMAYGFKVMIMFEGINEGVQWHNLWQTATPDDNLKFGHLMIMLAVDAVLYLLIALYVEAIFPGEYGIPQPWYFPLTVSYWCGRPTEASNESESIEGDGYEKEPSHLQLGIQIKHLRKSFSNKKVAVQDLSLNMYKDQITVLLGHNGAGKTTTMSMLTGMLHPTSGTAIVGGYDIRTDIDGVRQSLGLCPQHNILFDDLTVREHLYFYCRLKGLTREETRVEVYKYIDLLQLIPKADSRSSTLSGGMKRKLSVAVALCGRSRVVMCDEPTAGMDPAARRALWDLLQSQKKDRTILLTTHFMDEADLLGDRIAIMAGGRLQCCGSSFFLKKKYGAGYNLIMDKSADCDVEKVTDLLRKHIPSIKAQSNIGSELTYLLNEKDSPLFESMLGDLEKQSGDLGVLSYGISLTTLEEVFMKVGASHDQEEPIDGHGNDQDVIENAQYDNKAFEYDAKTITLNNNQESVETKLTFDNQLLSGWQLYSNQFLAMFIKHILTILRSWLLYLIHNAIAVSFLALTIVVIRNIGFLEDLPKFKFELDSYHEPITVITKDLHDNRYAGSYIDILKSNKKAYTDWKNESMSKMMLEQTEKDTSAVRVRYITGASFEGNLITGYFNNDPYHSPPLSLQMVINAILKKQVSKEHNIQIFNHPLPFSALTRFFQLQQGNNLGFQVSFNLGFSMAFVSAFYVMFYIRERSSYAKHLQFVSGVQVIPFWASAYICDLITFLFTSVLVVITMVVFQEDGFKTVGELGRLFSILLYFGFSMLPMMYLASYIFDTPSTGYTRLVFLNIFTGCAAFLIIQVISQPQLNLQHISDVLHWIFLLIPHYSLTTGVRDIYTTYSTIKLCNIMQGVAQLEQCREIPTYYGFKSPGIGRNVVFSFLIGIFMICILLLIEFRVIENIRYKIFSNKLSSASITPEDLEDVDVQNERKRIKDLTSEQINSSALVMRDITKYYTKRFVAVNNLCLNVNKYECFGLLGVNGAGKTTTFKMMTGDTKISHGDAWINGLSLKSDMKNIYQLIGYCPQFDALLNELTCMETITIFGLLRGMTLQESKYQAEKLSRDFDFRQHLHKKVKELSGGNKRKLSTSLALIGDPLVIYLDEPTTGMDPATKRYLWNALCKVRDSGKCIILTSHSMEECEALCTRLAIMVNGTFMCLGSTQHLKSKFSEGYTLIIKVKKTEGTDCDELKPIEEFVHEKFNDAIIREKHKELVTFYIPGKSLPWSRMFGIMEESKTILNVEDYSLGQSSLEQVFLSFTKYQRSDPCQY